MVYSIISYSRTNDNDNKEHLENSKIMFSLSKPLLFFYSYIYENVDERFSMV